MKKKLSLAQALFIRGEVLEGRATRKEMQVQFNVSLETIHRIVRGDTHSTVQEVRLGAQEDLTEADMAAIKMMEELGLAAQREFEENKAKQQALREKLAEMQK
jgi:hypothetical protein